MKTLARLQNLSKRAYSSKSSWITEHNAKYVPGEGHYPLGFSVSGTFVGIKPSNTSKPDLALITSDRPCSAAAVFTKNKFQAAPVTFSRSLLQRKKGVGLRSVLINSGCANAVTGKGGLEDAGAMANKADRAVGVEDVDKSFNSITIDGDTSTNDTVALLANGAAGGQEITSEGSQDYKAFQQVLTNISTELAQLVVRDGEGATKFVTITVTEAASEQGARKIASTIARSPLVKTALYGMDANWGRILCAVGYSLLTEPGTMAARDDSSEQADNNIDSRKTSVSLVSNDGKDLLALLVNGEPQNVDERRASEILRSEDIEILVQLGTGREEAEHWTCDLSHDFITINADYRS
ncbi:Arginine biosynthesis bifunctional protein ArgJ, mitochondrial [Fusarium chlamydosporum]